MFQNLQETVKLLNADVKSVANCEKAKKLRKKLITIGLPLGIGGFLGMFVCFILFTIFTFNAVGAGGFSVKIIIPFVLIIPCAIIGGIGSSIASIGFKIVIVGYATGLIDEKVGSSCPVCGEAIGNEMLFCPRCGAKVRKECANCKHVNSDKNEYCEKCGIKLN